MKTEQASESGGRYYILRRDDQLLVERGNGAARDVLGPAHDIAEAFALIRRDFELAHGSTK